MRFTTLWIYTILKHRWFNIANGGSFTTLWIYTILKLTSATPCQSPGFYYLMDLHYSQTKFSVNQLQCSFTTLWIYTILKRLVYSSSGS